MSSSSSSSSSSLLRMDDLIIAIAYFSIPLQIMVSLYRYPRLASMDWKVCGLFILFALFIFLCGAGHLLRCLESAHYLMHSTHTEGLVRAVNIATAVISLSTALYLLPLVPTIMSALDAQLQELQTLNHELMESKQQLITFMAFLCHEIRNPLFAITSSVTFLSDLVDTLPQQQLAANRQSSSSSSFLAATTAAAVSQTLSSSSSSSSSLPGDIQAELRSIEQSSNLMLRLVNDVLDISKLESGKLQLEYHVFDLHQLLQGVSGSMYSKHSTIHKTQNRHPTANHRLHQHYFGNTTTATATGNTTSSTRIAQEQEEREDADSNSPNNQVTFGSYLDPNLPRFVKGDSIRILQILYNLLSNASKFTDAGSIQLHVNLLSSSSLLVDEQAESEEGDNSEEEEEEEENGSDSSSCYNDNNNSGSCGEGGEEEDEEDEVGEPGNDEPQPKRSLFWWRSNTKNEYQRANTTCTTTKNGNKDSSRTCSFSSSDDLLLDGDCDESSDFFVDMEQQQDHHQQQGVPDQSTTTTTTNKVRLAKGNFVLDSKFSTPETAKRTSKTQEKKTRKIPTTKKNKKNKYYIVEFVVRDTGCGIPNYSMQDIFEPYAQSKLSDYRKHGGTGLGLTILSRLVEFMGGGVDVTSTEGVGSCFSVQLPLEKVDLLDEHVVEEPDVPSVPVIAASNSTTTHESSTSSSSCTSTSLSSSSSSSCSSMDYLLSNNHDSNNHEDMTSGWPTHTTNDTFSLLSSPSGSSQQRPKSGSLLSPASPRRMAAADQEGSWLSPRPGSIADDSSSARRTTCCRTPTSTGMIPIFGGSNKNMNNSMNNIMNSSMNNIMNSSINSNMNNKGSLSPQQVTAAGATKPVAHKPQQSLFMKTGEGSSSPSPPSCSSIPTISQSELRTHQPRHANKTNNNIHGAPSQPQSQQIAQRNQLLAVTTQTPIMTITSSSATTTTTRLPDTTAVHEDTAGGGSTGPLWPKSSTACSNTNVPAPPPTLSPTVTTLLPKFPKGTTPSVLIVDDNAINRRILSRMLCSFGIKCETAENGLRAVEIMQQHLLLPTKAPTAESPTSSSTRIPLEHDDNDDHQDELTPNQEQASLRHGSCRFGMILMDLSMPIMDGFEATRRIRQWHATIPIIALTACALEEGYEKAHQSGATEFATKPILRDDLYEKCQRYLLPSSSSSSSSSLEEELRREQ